jgi:zinc protease
MLRVLIACVFTLLAGHTFAAEKVYNAQTATLQNGMQIVVVPVHRAPAVTHMVWYKAGAADEPWGISGTAHFMEHLMFKGTPQVPSGEFSARVQRMGGNDNAFTSHDYTAYFQSVPVEKLGDVMRMEAGRMNDLTPKLSDIFSEKNVVMEERRQTTESNPAALLGEQMRQALFPNHQYGRPVIGWMREIESLKWIDALVFYRQWYAPNNAVLVISGDVTLAQVLPMAQATYGRLKREDVPARVRPVSPVLDGDVRVTLKRADVREPQWVRMIRVPSARQDIKVSQQLSLLEDVLGGPTGLLYQRLVVAQKLATEIDVAYSPLAIDDASFAFYATPAAGVTLDKLEQGVEMILADIAAKGFTDAVIQKSVMRMQDAAVYERDSLAGPAMNIGYALATGVTLDDVETWPYQLEAVKPADVQGALQIYILSQKGVTGRLEPQVVKP